MNSQELKQANELSKKIDELEFFINFGMEKRPKSLISIIKSGLRRYLRAYGYGALDQKEYTLSEEAWEIINDTLKWQLDKYKKDLANIGGDAK